MNGTPVRPEDRHGRVGVARRVRSAGGEVHLRPADARVGERGARGDRRHLEARHAGMAAEGVDADADDRRRRSCSFASSAGRKAKVTAPPSPGAGTSTSSIGMPMRSCGGSASVSRASTRTSPGQLDVADAVGLERPRPSRVRRGLRARSTGWSRSTASRGGRAGAPRRRATCTPRTTPGAGRPRRRSCGTREPMQLRLVGGARDQPVRDGDEVSLPGIDPQPDSKAIAGERATM